MTLRLDKPLNDIATHIAYLHLEPLPGFLSIGLHVPAGEVIGYSGGAQAQGIEKVPVGIALYNGDIYGYGPTFDMYNAVGNPQLDPALALKKAGSKPDGKQSAQDIAQSIVSAIKPDASVAELLASMDVALAIANPIDVANRANNTATYDVQVPNPIPLLANLDIPIKIADPLGYLGDVAEALLQNFAAVTVRSLFILFGTIILVAVVWRAYNAGISQVLEPIGGAEGLTKAIGAIA